MEEGGAMARSVEALVEEARQLPLPQQLSLIRELARSIQSGLEAQQAFGEELTAWDALSDEALEKFESTL
jgi:hypothetical protein